MENAGATGDLSRQLPRRLNPDASLSALGRFDIGTTLPVYRDIDRENQSAGRRALTPAADTTSFRILPGPARPPRLGLRSPTSGDAQLSDRLSNTPIELFPNGATQTRRSSPLDQPGMKRATRHRATQTNALTLQDHLICFCETQTERQAPVSTSGQLFGFVKRCIWRVYSPLKEQLVAWKIPFLFRRPACIRITLKQAPPYALVNTMRLVLARLV